MEEKRCTEKLEVFNKELENIKEQPKMNNTIIELKNTLEAINSRRNDSEEQTGGLEERVLEITAVKEKNEKGNEKK